MARKPIKRYEQPYEQMRLPRIPDGRKLCPGCFDLMDTWYGWYSSDRVCHIMLIHNCGSRTKTKLIHIQLDKRGEEAQKWK